jgi:hypothetical protein
MQLVVFCAIPYTKWVCHLVSPGALLARRETYLQTTTAALSLSRKYLKTHSPSPTVLQGLPNLRERNTSCVAPVTEGGMQHVQHLCRRQNMKQSPSWEVDSRSARREILRLLCNPKFHYRVHKTPTNGTYHKPDESSPQLKFVMLSFMLIIM